MDHLHEIRTILPIAVAVGSITYILWDKFSSSAAKARAEKALLNLEIKKEISKVADAVDIEDIGQKAVFCRCWRSKKFPYCDGSHAKHNECTGDNVGPLIVKSKEK